MKRWLFLLLGLLLLAGCSKAGSGESEPGETILPVIKDTEGKVIAEAAIEPAHWVELRFKAGGEVAEVLVKEGDQVAAGAPLIRLGTDELTLSLQNAQQEVAAQEAALAQLVKGATDKVIARADKDNADRIAQAEVTLRLKELQWAKARLEDPDAAIIDARARVNQLRLQLAQARVQDPASSLASAQVELERAKIALDDTQNEYDKALDRPWEDQAQRDQWTDQLEQVQLNYRLAQAQLDGAYKAQRAHEISLEVMAVQLRDAETQLARAIATRDSYTITLDSLAAEVDAARLNLEALRTWDNPNRDKATDEQIAQAEARLRQTEIDVDQLKVQIEDAELRAPLAGTVVDVRVEVGEQVGTGEVVVVLATLDQLQARTTDLTELDVAQITEGQSVEVSVDALPDLTFPGVVQEISLRGRDYRGDVVYDVTVDLGDSSVPKALRWGMTAMVEIETK